MKNIINTSKGAVDQLTQTMNSTTQYFTTVRRELLVQPIADTYTSGRLIDMGLTSGAYVASAARYLGTWVVGRGIKPSDASLPPKNETLLALKQHGVMGYALRRLIETLAKLCRIDATNNLGISLADAAMAALRLLCVTVPEVIFVTLFFYAFAVAQFTVDCGYKLWLLSCAAACNLSAFKTTSSPSPSICESTSECAYGATSFIDACDQSTVSSRSSV